MVQCGLGLAIDIDSINAITNQTTITVTGELDSTNYVVWVNGVKATATGGGNLSAYNVPVNSAGTAVFEALAIPTSDNGGYGMNNGGGGFNSSMLNPGNPGSTTGYHARLSRLRRINCRPLSGHRYADFRHSVDRVRRGDQ